jgi:glutamyl-tRNA synthetase
VDDPRAWEKTICADGAVATLADARAALASVEPFEAERIESELRSLAERRQLKPRDVFQPVRVAIAGTTVSPGIFESLAVLGREESLRRIDDALRRAPAV